MHPELQQKIQSVLETAFDETLNKLRQDLSGHFEATGREVWEAAVVEAQESAARSARAEMAESLCKAVGRIRSESSAAAVAVALVEVAAQYAARTALFIHREGRLRGFRVAGPGGDELQASFERIDLPLSEAPAFSRTVEGKVSVITDGGSQQLSSAVAEVLALQPEDRVHLFPVVVRGRVLAVLCAEQRAAEGGAEVQSAPIELLKSVAEAWLEAVATRKKTLAEQREAIV